MSDEQVQFEGDAEDRVSRITRQRDTAEEQLVEARELLREVLCYAIPRGAKFHFKVNDWLVTNPERKDGD